MKRLIFLFAFLAISGFAFSQNCELKITKLTKSEWPDSNWVKLDLEIFSSCYLETYPFLEVKRKSDGKSVSVGELESFGQIGNTFDNYSVLLEVSDSDVDDFNFFMVHSMGSRTEPIEMALILPETELEIKED